MATTPNVIVVVLDTTRVDDGLDPVVTPTLNDIATAGTVATDAISPAPWTLPAHASLVTGTYPSKHGAHAGHERLDASLPTLAELFQELGYDTLCVSNNTWLSIESGFDRGFDQFKQMWQLVQSDNALSEMVDVTEERRFTAVTKKLFDGNPVANAANALYRLFVRDRVDDGAQRTTEWVNRWLTDHEGDEPFFLLVNYLEPHLEYRPPRRLAEQFLPEGFDYDEAMALPQEPWEYLADRRIYDETERQVLRALYRAEIAYLDEQLAALKRTLLETGLWEETILLVTADHGENICDHGLMDHQYCLYETLINVPLVVHGGAFTDNGEIEDLVSLVDIPPTLLDAVDGRAEVEPETFQGRSFHPASTDDPHEFVVSEYMAPQPTMDALERHLDAVPDSVYEYNRSLRALRTESHKLIRGSDGSVELYDVTTDPGELQNIAAAHPGTVEELGGKLDEWVASFQHAETEADVHIDDDRKQRLEDLGYLQ